MESKTFTREELAHFDGLEGRKAYIAFYGWVFDITDSSLWQNGSHQGLHKAGEDLSNSLGRAPHGAGVLERVPRVGKLI